MCVCVCVQLHLYAYWDKTTHVRSKGYAAKSYGGDGMLKSGTVVFVSSSHLYTSPGKHSSSSSVRFPPIFCLRGMAAR